MRKLSYLILLLAIFFGFMAIAGGGVLNDLDEALLEIEELERNHMLENPPKNISSIAKREIALCKNSDGLRAYIKETEKTLGISVKWFKILSTSFIILIFIRIIRYWRNKAKI